MNLVTGGTGLVGAHLIFDLLQRGERVRATKRENSNLSEVLHIFSYYTNNPQELYDKIEWVNVDLLDYESVVPILEGVSDIYHCAAYVSFVPSDRKNILRINIKGTANMVNAALECNIRKFCFVSSSAALGNPVDSEPIHEKLIWKTAKKRSVYAISKFKSEMEVWRGINEGLDAVIVNPSIIIGPGNWQRSSGALFTALYKGLRFYTKGVTGYVDVKDVVSSMVMLMKSQLHSERFILSSENLSYQEVFNLISDVLQVKKPSIQASKFMANIAVIFEKLKFYLTGIKPSITKETVASGFSNVYFSNKKVTEALGITLRPISESIREYGTYFQKDLNTN